MNAKIKPTVSVLLSTYNGHRYIRTLVESVLAQENVDVRLVVRDDGSVDDTIEILRSYHDPRIKITLGHNIKPAMSYLKLLRECDDTDYYAYCDQDDFWYPDKLRTAIDALRTIEEPALFISTYDVCDEKLHTMFTRDMKYEEELRLQDVLLYRAPSACNMVFNHSLRKVMNCSNPSFVRMHDYWTLIVTLAHEYMIITDSTPLMKYRQHMGECVGVTPTIQTRIKRLIYSFRKGNNERWRQTVEAYNAYKDQIPMEQREILEAVVQYRNSVGGRIKLIRDDRFRTSSKYINILFRMSVLMGKF